MIDKIFLSILVPYHETCGNIRPGIEKLLFFLDKRGIPSEILIISGKSKMFKALPKNLFPHTSLRILPKAGKLSQSAAYIEGFKKARGEWSVLLDADMTEFTALVGQLIDEIDTTHSIIRTYRDNVSGGNLLRKAGSWMVNAIFNTGSGKKLRDVGSSLSAYKRSVYQNVSNPRFNRYHDFLPFAVVALAEQEKIKEIPIKIPRTPGQNSSYSLTKLIGITIRIIYLKIIFALRASK
jgi:glycosyltransferase involved in cell wall biosynthesis